MKFSRQLLLVAAAVIMSAIMREAFEHRKKDADWSPLIPVAPTRVVTPPTFTTPTLPADDLGDETGTGTMTLPSYETTPTELPSPTSAERIIVLSVFWKGQDQYVTGGHWYYVVTGRDDKGMRWSCTVSKEIYEAMPAHARLVIREGLCSTVPP